MKQYIYRDIILCGDSGGAYDDLHGEHASNDSSVNHVKSDGLDELNRLLKEILEEVESQKINDHFENSLTSRTVLRNYEEEINVVLPHDDLPSDDNSPKIIEIEKINVKRNNTTSITDLKSEKIKEVQFFHSLANSKKEFEYLIYVFWPIIRSTKIDLNEFALYVLGCRELLYLTKDKKFDIFSIKEYAVLKNAYLENFKYLIFSQDQNWRSHIFPDFKNVKTHISYQAYVKEKFSDEELKKLIKANFDNVAYLDKIVQWVKKRGTLLYILDLMRIYCKNQELFLSYDVDFNSFKINVDNELTKFENDVRDINSYKILTKLLQRLDSKKRQEVRSNSYIFNDYLNVCRKMYDNRISFDVIEPVLRKIHTYRDASYLYNALKASIDEINLYQIFELAEKTKDAKVIFFNEEDQTMLIRINSYAAMQVLGCRTWCIRYDARSYYRYKFPFGRYYIYYDAKKDAKIERRNTFGTNAVIDRLYVLGFTITLFNNLKYVYNKRDNNVGEEHDVLSIFKKYKKFFKM